MRESRGGGDETRDRDDGSLLRDRFTMVCSLVFNHMPLHIPFLSLVIVCLVD